MRTTTATSRSTTPRKNHSTSTPRLSVPRYQSSRGHPEQRLGGLPQQQRAPPRPGQHRQRQQPQRVLRAPHLVEQQEAGDQQEGQLGHPRPHRRGQRQPGDPGDEQHQEHGDDGVEHGGDSPVGERPVEQRAGRSACSSDVPDGVRVGRAAAVEPEEAAPVLRRQHGHAAAFTASQATPAATAVRSQVAQPPGAQAQQEQRAEQQRPDRASPRRPSPSSTPGEDRPAAAPTPTCRRWPARRRTGPSW